MAHAVTAAVLHVLPDPESLARAAAGRILGVARERVSAIERAGKKAAAVHVALSGGATPRRAFELLGGAPYADIFPWDALHVWQVDERWLPPDHPESNRRMLIETLLSRVPVPKGNLHFIDTSAASPDDGAKAYESALREALPAPKGGFPRFDLVHLGLGADGHTASLFPGSAALAERAAWVTTATGGDPAVARVTLTLPAINAAAAAVFVVAGASRAEALAKVRAGGPLPAARVAPVRGTLTFLADAAAARLCGDAK
jgi:6-phosphogluconolactonase